MALFGKATKDDPFPENCYSCRFYERDLAECHRRINVIVGPAKNTGHTLVPRQITKWVNTVHDDWCGDFKRAIRQGNGGY